MTAVIQADSFIETEDCDGPRYNRNAPSRETPGILMTELQNKYITEFELPYRNMERYIKEIGNNWNRLNDRQRALVKQSFQSMGMIGRVNESFGNVSSGSLVCDCKKGNCTCKEKFGNSDEIPTSPRPVDPNVTNFIKYLATKPIDNTEIFMNTLWNTTSEQTLQIGLTKDQINKIRDSMYQWSVDNTYALHSNWKSGLLLFFFLLIIIILIIIAAAGTGNEGGNGFGKSLFGRHLK